MSTNKLKVAIVALTTVIIFSGCQKDSTTTYQGYIEGEFVNIASSQSGRLDKLFVKKGQSVAKDSALFALECDSEVAALSQAKAELAAAISILDDIQKGARVEEQNVIEARLSQARTNADNLKIQADRSEALYKINATSKVEMENSVAMAKSSAAQVAELQNSLRVLKLSAREDQIKAQKAHVKQAEFAVKQAEWKLNQKALKAPKNALVFDTIYREGEFVVAGGVVARLLPPENIKIRFFVPQKIAEKLMLNQKLSFHRSSDNTKFTGTLSYISTEAEYTPPLIYSNESKERLVFMAEAYPRPEDAKLFHSGQPIKVSLDEL